MMQNVNHPTAGELEAGLHLIRQSPKDVGTLSLIVRRPGTEQRELVDMAELDLAVGLVGDNWRERGSRHTPDQSAHPDAQVTVMNSRLIALVAQEQERWSLAGDQLYVDLDLGVENLPPGTRLAVGSAVIEVTAMPHTGCGKFATRFGRDATRFVNSPVGKKLNLRGINAKVVKPGTIRVGDAVRKI